MSTERDYVLGTHDEELARLGLQHRVWRSVALDCWQKAGVTIGSHVLDLGAGPGYAAVDLAEIVGPTGKVVGVERSANFIRAFEKRRQSRGLANIEIHELDLMTDALPGGPYDFSWCRWVASFVTDPELLVQKLARVMRKGSLAMFHEYGHYLSWRFIPRLASQELFAQEVAASWAATGGKTDIALDLPAYLTNNGFQLRSIVPRIYCIGPRDYMWQWPVSYIGIGLARLKELGRIDDAFAAEVQREVAAAQQNPDARIITPLVLEITAERIG
jgi:SAM-dependent methyltransferase